jgi:hypothetical protein
MVFYFTSHSVKPPVVMYMGRDKYENEELIKYSWPEDIWCVRVLSVSKAQRSRMR